MILKDFSLIKGLKYLPNFITPPQKQQILSIINSHQWCNRLRRRQQYYGIKYFQTKLQDAILQPTTSNDHHPLTTFQFLIDKTIKQQIFTPTNPPNQVLINHYQNVHRLGLHVEDITAFGDIIVGISIGSTDFLRLVDVSNRDNQYLVELQDCSCYVLSDDARFKWRHGIGRAINNVKYKSEEFERISLTIRHVIDSRRKVEEIHYGPKLTESL